jgi:YfiH family protein
MKLYTSKLLKVKHTFTCREGGVSKPPFNSLNLAFHVGDKRDDVIKNHKILANFLDYDFKKLVFMNQIHSNKVVVVDEEFFSIPSCDALVTNQKGIPLMIMSADCAPVLFYDDKQEVIAVAHVGRVGAFGDIVSNVINVMIDKFESNPKDIKVAVGPSIKSCCYEVSQKEITQAKSLGYGFACSGMFLDINAIISNQLEKNGIKKENIEFLNICTKCNAKEFFSYRDEKITGRNTGVIVL